MAENDEDNRPGPKQCMACFVAMIRYGMGRAATPDEALNQGAEFVKAAEARWPNISRMRGGY